MTETIKHHKIFDEKKELLTIGETAMYMCIKKADVGKTSAPIITVYTEDMKQQRLMCRTSDIRKMIIDKRKAKAEALAVARKERERARTEKAEKMAAQKDSQPSEKKNSNARRARNVINGKTPVILTSSQVADMMGVSLSTVCKWGNTEIGPISPAFSIEKGNSNSHFWRFKDILEIGK